MLALMIPTPPVEQSGALLAAVIAWHDLALVLAGLLLLVLARLAVYRRRDDDEDHATHVPLIEMPTPAPPGQPPRPVWPPPSFFEQPVAERSAPEDPAAAEEAWGEEVSAGLVRFHRPPEGTLQLLPGRLDIVSGNEGVDAIRFVKVPGKEPMITFGRSPGEPHTHVELQSPTVSRKHAAMRFEKGSWHIANLSTTNPVVVRGKQLTVTDEPVRLEDGDRLEMGEVTFRFHARHVVERVAEVADLRSAELLARLPQGVSPVPAQPQGWSNGAQSRPARPTAIRAHTLTGREVEIAQMVADRKSNKAIGDVLDISPRTVSTHLTNIFRKLDVASRGELVDYMKQHDIG